MVEIACGFHRRSPKANFLKNYLREFKKIEQYMKIMVIIVYAWRKI
jgi:hypothetical protein